ncbi:MAG: cytochrome C [Chlorobi bacterium]|nr:cytochrome C [Chlorobiota bacterium]
MSKFLAYIAVMLLINPISTIMGQEFPLGHHSFKGNSWSSNNPCRPCHITQSDNMSPPSSLNWNQHDTATTFQLYSRSTVKSYPNLPSGKTKQCLSCHDETVAPSNHIVMAPEGNNSPRIYIRDSHPVSFVYDASLAMKDKKLRDPSVTMSGLGGTIEEDLLDNGRLECTSCHDVHNIAGSGNPERHYETNGRGATVSYFLRKSNEGSALCLTCHNI